MILQIDLDIDLGLRPECSHEQFCGELEKQSQPFVDESPKNEKAIMLANRLLLCIETLHRTLPAVRDPVTFPKLQWLPQRRAEQSFLWWVSYTN